LRQKQQRDEQDEIENDDDDDERKMRRISYLRATGHENQFIIDSDIDSPASLPNIGTPEAAAQQLKRFVFLIQFFFPNIIFTKQKSTTVCA
jgi:hypothetical protein